ncbi:unnamed protein product [Protopolystoma xenopodis]|uniref:Uncharacterized protein n=1 Tax=Protopolystoma xenopodis TaxID=117903 RepID=A0A3S5CKQ4_9PLAT|nr:unnamed protein product [Protopolystoma xenopodis]
MLEILYNRDLRTPSRDLQVPISCISSRPKHRSPMATDPFGLNPVRIPGSSASLISSTSAIRRENGDEDRLMSGTGLLLTRKAHCRPFGIRVADNGASSDELK